MPDYPVTFPAEGPIALRIKQRAGNVFVAATNTDQVHLDVRAANNRSGSHDLVKQTTVHFSAGSLAIDVPRVASAGFGSDAVDLVLTVPTASIATIETGSGDVQLRGGFGSVSVTSGSGDIVAEQLSDGRLTTGSGDIRVGEVDEVHLKTGSGDVRVDRAVTRLDVDTASGTVDVTRGAPVTTIRAASGDITIGEMAGVLEIKSASGDVEVRRAVDGEVRARTSSGDLTVGVASGTAAKLDCSSISGRVVSELERTDAPDDSDRQLLVTSTSASGSVIIRRA